MALDLQQIRFSKEADIPFRGNIQAFTHLARHISVTAVGKTI